MQSKGPHHSMPSKRRVGSNVPGLTDKIPVHGPVYIMRGAVYLGERDTFISSPLPALAGTELQDNRSGRLTSSTSGQPQRAGSKGSVSFATPLAGAGSLFPPALGSGNNVHARASPSSLPSVAPKHSLFNTVGDYGMATSTPTVAADPSVLLSPPLPHQRTPLDKVLQQAEGYLDAEVRLLSSAPERDPVSYRAATAAAYGTTVRMLLPSVAAKVAALAERCLREYEIAMAMAAQQASQPTRSAEERTKMELELRTMYMQAAEDRSKELDRRQAELDNNATSTAHRVLQLENQLASARQEVLKLKATQSDETDRFSNMAQSVLESRLAAQKAEISLQEMKERYDRVKVTEMVYMDLLQDHQDMNLLLREKRIPFKSRIHFSVDDLLGEPSAAVLARHAETIRAQHHNEMLNSLAKR